MFYNGNACYLCNGLYYLLSKLYKINIYQWTHGILYIQSLNWCMLYKKLVRRPHYVQKCIIPIRINISRSTSFGLLPQHTATTTVFYQHQVHINLFQYKRLFLRIREPELGGFSCWPVNYYQTKGGGGISKFWRILQVVLYSSIYVSLHIWQ